MASGEYKVQSVMAYKKSQNSQAFREGKWPVHHSTSWLKQGCRVQSFPGTFEEGKRVGKHSHLIWTIRVRHIPKLCTPHISPLNVHGAHLCTIIMHTLPRHTIHTSVAGTLFMLIHVERKLKKLSRNFLVKVITRYIKTHYEKSQNTNFLALIRSCILLA